MTNHRNNHRRIMAILLSLLLLASLPAMAENLPQLQDLETGSPAQTLEVKADYQGNYAVLGKHPLKLSVPEGWGKAEGKDGAILTIWEPVSMNSLRVEEMQGGDFPKEGILAAFSGDPNFSNVQEVTINDKTFVHYVSQKSDVRGFVFHTGSAVLIFKFEPAANPAFTYWAENIMSTLTWVSKAKAGAADKPAATPRPAQTAKPGAATPLPEPTATPAAAVINWQMLLDAAAAGLTEVYIAQDLHRGELDTAVFTYAVKIKSIDGNKYVLDGNGQAAIRVQTAEGGKVEGLSEIENLHFTNTNAGDLEGGALYVNGDLLVSGSEFDNNAAYNGGAIAVTGNLFILDSTFEANQAVGDPKGGNGGAVYADGTLTVENATFIGNQANNGGALSATQSITLVDTTVSENAASLSYPYGTGGGIYASSGTISITGGSIDNNTAFSGGGIGTNDATIVLEGADIWGNESDTKGGGIFNNYGSTTVNDSVISMNTANAGQGGGIYSFFGSVEVIDSSITDNKALTGVVPSTGATAEGAGGGIYSNNSTLTISETDGGNGTYISGNHADSKGGGIYKTANTLTIEGGAISGNDAGTGGGIYSEQSSITMTGGEITANEATGTADESAPTKGSGGGIYMQSSTLTVQGGELKLNTANSSGGGIYSASGKVNVTGGSVTDNQATRDGGGIATLTSMATVTVSGTGTVTSNDAGINGGGVYTEAASVTYTGGAGANINSNTAVGSGDQIYAQGGGLVVDAP